MVEANHPESKDEFERQYSIARMNVAEIVNVDRQLDRSRLLAFERAFAVQLGVFRAIPEVVETKALRIRDLLARDMYENEFGVARDLFHNGHIRAAGVYAGVALETHLRLMCEKRGVKLDKLESIFSLNEKLKKHYSKPDPYLVVAWMAPVRNACAHTGPDPDPQKVKRLIDKAEEFIATES